MKKEKNAFTLVELLSVVVILGITFMFLIPSITSLFTKGNKTETELIEEKVLSAAKEYVNNIDGTFYTKLYKEGDTNYIYKSDLINAGLITNEEISKLNTFAGVKGEVIKNDRIRYTVEYINASNNEYTNEELYLMIKNMQNNGSGSDNSKINEISDKVDSLTNKVNSIEETTANMSMLKVYPVGSVYVSTINASPKELFGGEWEQLKDRFLLGAGDTYTAGSTGGESEHLLTIDEMPSHNHNFTNNYRPMVDTGLLGGWGSPIQTVTSNVYLAQPQNMLNTGGSQPHNNMPPYLTVYMWKRTA